LLKRCKTGPLGSPTVNRRKRFGKRGRFFAGLALVERWQF
jgi:hypothetical protein